MFQHNNALVLKAKKMNTCFSSGGVKKVLCPPKALTSNSSEHKLNWNDDCSPGLLTQHP